MRKPHERGTRESRLADGWTVEGSRGTGAREPRAEALTTGPATTGSEAAGIGAPRRPASLSNGGVVLLGAIGGVYLLYTLVWFSWVSYYSSANSELAEGSGVLGGILQEIVFWIAPFAPALWFFAVLILHRGAKLGRIVLWLMIGAVLLVPLPMFSSGAAS